MGNEEGGGEKEREEKEGEKKESMVHLPQHNSPETQRVDGDAENVEQDAELEAARAEFEPRIWERGGGKSKLQTKQSLG